MKHILSVAVSMFVLSLSAGCQQPVTPPQQSCSPAGSYTALNPVGSTTNPPATSISFTDTPGGAKCYMAQGYLPPSGTVQGQYGAASNIVGPTAGGATGKVNLSGTCSAGAGQTCTGVLWVFYSAPAITALAPGSPNVAPPQSANVIPLSTPSPNPVVAANIPTAVLKIR